MNEYVYYSMVLRSLQTTTSFGYSVKGAPIIGWNNVGMLPRQIW